MSWNNQTKHTSSFSGQSKTATTFSSQNKNTSVFTNQSKSTGSSPGGQAIGLLLVWTYASGGSDGSFTNISKNPSSWDNQIKH